MLRRLFPAIVTAILLSILLASTAVRSAPADTIAAAPQAPGQQAAQADIYNTLRVYGHDAWGAGLISAFDPRLGPTRHPEDLPYSDQASIFDPAGPQAPRKDFITWNPAYMHEGETFDELQRQGLYDRILAGGINASEKVWFREWYEPSHWDKDLDANGSSSSSIANLSDIVYPAIMQEFTYQLMEAKFLRDKPAPIVGAAGTTRIVFPVGMRSGDLRPPSMSPADTFGYGLTSLDANFDGRADIVRVDSEATFAAAAGVPVDFNGNGAIQTLDVNAAPLTGDELVVLSLDPVDLAAGGAVQFLDHVVTVDSVFNWGANLRIWYTGDLTPRFQVLKAVYINQLYLLGTSGTGLLAPNVGVVPPGAWFVQVTAVNTVAGTAQVRVGRALGAAYSAMDSSPNTPDVLSGDPWFLKRFYVDGHEYNVVAIGTQDYESFGYITLRTPNPKQPVQIDQHSVRLQDYAAQERLSVLPPYNYEHYILADNTALTAFSSGTAAVPYLGTLVGPVAPILQRNGPVPYPGVGANSPYANARELFHFYIAETRNPQYTGELKEKYGETGSQPPAPFLNAEFWYAEQFRTVPDQYTEFVLPDIRSSITGSPTPDLYLLTSAFIAPQAQQMLWTQNQPPFTPSVGERVNFWFDPTTGGKKYKNQQGLRVYGENSYGAGDPTVITDTRYGANSYPVEVQPYTDPWAIFNPQFPQAPVKDSLTFDPAYLNEFSHTGEELASLYGQIAIEGRDGREKVYSRMWYEPQYLDKILRFRGPTTSALEVEPNSSYSLANPISENQAREGTISPANDADWYVFTLSTASYVRIDALGGATTTTVLALFNSTDIAAMNPNPLLLPSEPVDSDTGLPARIEAQLPAGTYYIALGDGSATPSYTLVLSIREAYQFPAVMQEFTYMLLDTQDQPTHGQAGQTSLVFPMATGAAELPKPDAGTFQLPTANLPSFGYGLTGFDANFDGQNEIVHVHSERSLSTATGIFADFNGNNTPDLLDVDNLMNGNELVVLTVENLELSVGQSAQFLDNMVTVQDVNSTVGQAQLQVWYTGGGIHALGGGGYSLQPDRVGSAAVYNIGDMVIAGRDRSTVYRIPRGSGNGGQLNGPWFAFVQAVNSSTGKVTLSIGRALGATHSAIDNGAGLHDLTAGDPWYLKRFFVDGHEYNVVAIRTEPAENPGEPFEFKFLTLRTPVPKVTYVNTEDSQVLQGYFLGTVLGVDTGVISVLPPFNIRHTVAQDIVRRTVDEFADPDAYDDDCSGLDRTELLGRPALSIRIVDEAVEPQFFGGLAELRSLFGRSLLWRTRQYNTLPDHYTDLQLPQGELYLLTSSWRSDQSWLRFYSCNPAPYQTPLPPATPAGDMQNILSALTAGKIPATNVAADYTTSPTHVDRDPYFDAGLTSDPKVTVRVKFWYDPADNEDIYVNQWIAPAPVTKTYTLRPGWNLWSTDLAPVDPAIGTVLHGLGSNLITALGFSCGTGGLSYYPDLPISLNTLKTIDPYHGYWLKLTQDPTLTVTGTPIPDNAPLSLCPGWNLVSYLPDAPLPGATALASIDGLYSVVLGYDAGGLSFYPDLPSSLNTLKQLQPGRGYWIKMNTAGTLVYPTVVAAAEASTMSQAPAFTPSGVTLTNRWMDVYSLDTRIDGAPVPLGSRISAYTPGGLQVGETIVTVPGWFGVMPVYGDDPTTPQGDGALVGDALTFYIDGKRATVISPGSASWLGDKVRMEVQLTVYKHQFYLPLTVH